MGHAPYMEKKFLAEITKVDHQLSETFSFMKILYVLTELKIFFHLEWCFSVKKVSFPLLNKLDLLILLLEKLLKNKQKQTKEKQGEKQVKAINDDKKQIANIY